MRIQRVGLNGLMETPASLIDLIPVAMDQAQTVVDVGGGRLDFECSFERSDGPELLLVTRRSQVSQVCSSQVDPDHRAVWLPIAGLLQDGDRLFVSSAHDQRAAQVHGGRHIFWEQAVRTF
jgi:hypothetical protein